MPLFIDAQKQDRFSILFEGKTKDGNITKVRVRFSQADEKNGNGRTYPLALWNREVSRIQDDINAGGMLGMSAHPKDGVTDAGDVSHIVKKLWMDGKTGWAELAILDTTKGKNLKTIMKAGGRLAVSTRGFGTSDKDSGVVNDDYKLDNLDIVVNPSFKGGFFSQDSVFESQDLSKKNLNKSSSGAHQGDGHMESKDGRYVKIMKLMFEADLKDGTFKGSLRTYIDENEHIVKAVLAVEDGEYADIETALKEMFGEAAVQELADLKKSKAIPPKPVTSGDVREMARIARVPASELAEAINKENDKPAPTERRIALYQQVWSSFGASATREKVDEIVDKLMKEEPAMLEKLKKKRLLVEAEEKVKEGMKKTKRLRIKQQMYKDGFLAGFKKEQIDTAIAKRMAQLDEEEMEV